MPSRSRWGRGRCQPCVRAVGQACHGTLRGEVGGPQHLGKGHEGSSVGHMEPVVTPQLPMLPEGGWWAFSRAKLPWAHMEAGAVWGITMSFAQDMSACKHTCTHAEPCRALGTAGHQHPSPSPAGHWTC